MGRWPAGRKGGGVSPRRARAFRCGSRTGGMRCVMTGRIGRIAPCGRTGSMRSEEHTSELQSLMRISYAVFCLKKKNNRLYDVDHKQCYTYHYTFLKYYTT